MTIEYRVAVPADLGRICAVLDNEFIFGKDRKISIAQRFPATFCAANIANIFVAEDNGRIVSAFLAKRFDWQQDEKTWCGAMIGAVYTDPQRRNEGLAGNLLKWGMQALQQDGAELAVLWTIQSEFYARLGWISADSGVFGSCVTASGDIEYALDKVKVVPLALSDERRIDAVRKQCLKGLVRREALDYHQVPIPAESVDVLLWNEGRETRSYALLGSKGTVGILYEMVGSEDGFADLWAAARKRHGKIVINDCAESRSHRWLTQHAGVAWENKKLAMWMPLSTELDIAQVSQWYIPYFDRI
jgi:predicted N-acetyltransferase YhbS